MGVEKLFQNIEQGKLGRNVGVSSGSSKLDSIIYGIQRKYLYTIGADTSGGKTSYAMDVFVYNLLKNSTHPVHILYYSFEMSADVLYAKLLSRYIYDEYKKVITFENILSLLHPISDDDYQYVQKGKEWLSSISRSIIFYDKALTPNGIYATCKEWLKTHGEFVQVGEHKEDYIEKDSNAYKVVLIDHVGLIGGTGSKKERIDLTVDFFIYFRNKCNISGVFIQQLNRNAKSMDRKTNGYELIQLDDFKDTSGTTDGSEVVIALFYPHREKIAKCENYPIQNVLKKRFRLVQVIKNRYGVSDVNIGNVFYGEIGMFKDLPLPSEINDYEPYLVLNYEDKTQDEEVNQFKL